jgi:hypothetical protein
VYYFNLQLVVIVFSELRFDQTDRGVGRTVKNKVRVFTNYCSCSVSEPRIAPEKNKLIGLQLRRAGIMCPSATVGGGAVEDPGGGDRSG